MISFYIRKQVLTTKAEAEKDGVVVPTTIAQYCVSTQSASKPSDSHLDMADFYDDDYMDDDDDEHDEHYYDDDDDSGNGES